MAWAATAWPKEMAFTMADSAVPAVFMAAATVSKAGPTIVPVRASGVRAGSATAVQSGGHFGRGGHGGWGDRGIAVHYTPEQRKQVMTINKDYKQKSEDLFKQDNITLKQYKAGLIALQKEKKTKLQALLTPQQKDEVSSPAQKEGETPRSWKSPDSKG
jgi:hypothetical protein